MSNYHVGVNITEGQGVQPVVGAATQAAGIIANFERGPLDKPTLVGNFSELTKIFGSKPAPGTTGWYSAKSFFAKPGSAPLYVLRVAGSSALKASVTLQDRQGSPANTLKIEAASEGAWGNDLAAKIVNYAILTTTLAATVNSGATQATLTSIGGIEVGSDVEFDNGSNQEIKRITAIDAATKVIHWSGGLVNTYNSASSTVTSQEFSIEIYVKGVLTETWAGLSMNDGVTFFCEKKVVSQLVSVTDLKSADTDYQDMPAVTASPSALTLGNDGLSDVVGSDYEGTITGDVKTGLYAFDEAPEVFRICCPNPKLTDVDTEVAYKSIVQAMIDYAEQRADVQVYADIPYGKSVTQAVTFGQTFESRHLALFYQWGKITENSLPIWIPGSALALGVAVAKDYTRGVFKAIGNESVPMITAISYSVTQAEHDMLNDAGINVFRAPYPGSGLLVYGSRTRSALAAWQFLSVSEYANYVARSLRTSTAWAVFEPHNSQFRKKVIREISAFFENEQRIGAIEIPGNPSSPAYLVKMDGTNNPQDQVALGIATVEVEYVPVGVAEKFVIKLTSSSAGFTNVAVGAAA